MQKIDLKIKSYEQLLVKNKGGAITKKIIFDLFI